jgi:hypothetical protein
MAGKERGELKKQMHLNAKFGPGLSGAELPVDLRGCGGCEHKAIAQIKWCAIRMGLHSLC